MSLLQSYLNSPKARKVLTTKPGEEGFSLIELVIVVAVLAALSAIAIPSFTNISLKAQATSAMSTIATIAKECAVKYAEDPSGSHTFGTVSLQGYNSLVSNASNAQSCLTGTLGTSKYTATATDPSKLPTFVYAMDGTKTCSVSAANAESATGKGCDLSKVAGATTGGW